MNTVVSREFTDQELERLKSLKNTLISTRSDEEFGRCASEMLNIANTILRPPAVAHRSSCADERGIRFDLDYAEEGSLFVIL